MKQNEKNTGTHSSTKSSSQSTSSYWLSKNPSKRWGELFFLFYTPIWVGVFGTVVVTKAFENFTDLEYMLIGLVVGVPPFTFPLLFPGQADKKLPISQRYWLKANIWIALFNFVGNYFWTHYFFQLLGARYTFPVFIKLNKIPVFLFLITQAYFCTYYALSTPLLRKLWTSMNPGPFRWIVGALATILMSYITAFMETWTIAGVPYYAFEDRDSMYIFGSTFYMLYFVISFPMFLRIDEYGSEHTNNNWSIWQAATESLASAMVVFILCDFWRLLIGGLGNNPNAEKVPFC